MGRNRVWLLALFIIVTAMGAVVVGVNSVRAAQPGAQPFGAGTVVESSFLIGRGPLDEEITANYWVLVGQDREEEALRARLITRTGTVLQEGLRRRGDGYGVTHFAQTGDVVRTRRPPRASAAMWSPDSIRRELSDNGYELVESAPQAGLATLAYERRAPLLGSPPAELFAAGGIGLDDVVGTVRRVFIGNDPFGIDLGEEAGYVLSDGSEFIPYYRHITQWEILDRAPAGVFDWSPPAAGVR